MYDMPTFLITKNLLQGKFSNIFAIKNSFPEIERRLNVKIISIKKVRKVYGSNTKSFFVRVLDSENIETAYFLKFGRNTNIDDELSGDLAVQKLLNTPKIILYSEKKTGRHEWILYQYVDGHLMNDSLAKNNSVAYLENLYDMERKKEMRLQALYSKTVSEIDYSDYLKSRANKLFHNRFFGEKYKQFYGKKLGNVSSMFNKVIFVNGIKLPTTVAQIIDSIHAKYTADKHKKVKSIIGHGDAHHGNIIIGKDIWFIDNEYAGIVTPYMELAKPYYNDLFGDLFFYEHRLLKESFKIINYKETANEIHINVSNQKPLVKYIKLTKIKLECRKELVNKNTDDFLSLNDYLFLCHILTKNPNAYPKMTRRLFILFAVLLSTFDPYKPESIFNYF